MFPLLQNLLHPIDVDNAEETINQNLYFHVGFKSCLAMSHYFSSGMHHTSIGIKKALEDSAPNIFWSPGYLSFSV